MLNNVTLQGRLTADPELKTTGNGTSVLSFSLAVERSYKAEGGERQTDFLNCVAWRSTAEFIERYFHKGDMMIIFGELQQRKWQDSDGNNRYTVEVIVSQVHFCGSRAAGSHNTANVLEAGKTTERGYSQGNPSDFMEVEANDDLPF